MVVAWEDLGYGARPSQSGCREGSAVGMLAVDRLLGLDVRNARGRADGFRCEITSTVAWRAPPPGGLLTVTVPLGLVTVNGSLGSANFPAAGRPTLLLAVLATYR